MKKKCFFIIVFFIFSIFLLTNLFSIIENKFKEEAIHFVKDQYDSQFLNIDYTECYISKDSKKIQKESFDWVIPYNQNIKISWIAIIGKTNTTTSSNECYAICLYNNDVGFFALKFLNSENHVSPFIASPEDI